MSLDLSSQASVRAAVEEIKNLVPKIDILIHSAGIMVTPYEKISGWGKGGEGVEGQFATNYLGAWLCVNLLIKDGVIGDGSRVVLTSSSAHRMGGVRLEDVNFSVRCFCRGSLVREGKLI